ncbi:MAG TPA: hypothetical protein VI462_11750 [Acidimicrobiia bacterium]|jgi:hypothetical protein
MAHAVASPAVVRTHGVHRTDRRGSIFVPDGRGGVAGVAGTVPSANGRVITTTTTVAR